MTNIKTVLLVEDNNDIRENLSEILEMAGYNVIAANNGKQGVIAAKQSKPDVIVCDIMMPELDGYGVLNILSADESTASIPFIFLTAKSENADLRKGMNMGADDYITKPFEEAELLKAIEVRLHKNAKLALPNQLSAEGIEGFMQNAQSLDDLIQLSKDRKRMSFKKKQPIYSTGGTPRGVYFIESGSVKTFLTSDNEKDYITNIYNRGNFFGYLAVLENNIYAESAEALEDSVLFFIPKHDFMEILLKNRIVSRQFIKMLSGDMVSQQERMLRLAYNSVRKRVAESLLMVQQSFNPEQKPNVPFQASRYDLASMVGTATESVIRTLSDFKDEKIIEVRGNQIIILDMKKLVNMKN
jgi:DNA-binding response OmpR family regulator